MLKRISPQKRARIIHQYVTTQIGNIHKVAEKIADAQLASCEAQLQEILAEERKKAFEEIVDRLSSYKAELEEKRQPISDKLDKDGWTEEEWAFMHESVQEVVVIPKIIKLIEALKSKLLGEKEKG